MAGASPRVLLLNPSGQEVRGCLHDVLCESGAAVDEVALQAALAMLKSPASPLVRGVGALPSSSEGYDCLLILGAPFGVLTGIQPGEDCGLQGPPGLAEAHEALICAFHNARKPVLGICLGSQLIARAFGGKVYSLPKEPSKTALPFDMSQETPPRLGLEWGWQSQDFTREAWSDPLISKALRGSLSQEHCLPAGKLEVKFQQWHGDTFTLPADAVALSTRPNCPGQIFRVGGLESLTYAFQCHIEVDEPMASKWCQWFACGFDPYATQESWSPLKTPGAGERVRAHLTEHVQDRTVQRAVAFTKLFFSEWLDRAARVRSATESLRTSAPLNGSAGDSTRQRSRSRGRDEDDMDVEMV